MGKYHIHITHMKEENRKVYPYIRHIFNHSDKSNKSINAELRQDANDCWGIQKEVHDQYTGKRIIKVMFTKD